VRKKWIGMAAGIALLVALAIPLGVGKAMALSSGNCFGPDFQLGHSNDVDNGDATSGEALTLSDGVLTFGHVIGGQGDVFCQARVAANSPIVVIYDLSASTSGECLAYSAADDWVYLHNPSGCNGTSLTYLQWKFIYLATARGYKIYALQSQYAASGDPCMSFIFGAPPQYNPVTLAACNGTDTNQFFIYEPS